VASGIYKLRCQLHVEYVRGIWTLVMFKASNLFSLSDTQLMKTVPGSFDTCF